ncbi:hypothetical protein [Candidatus Venteria ishoeyi]|uniref:Uncharacterized protein n=1 Tax=Candidatus Venteria ishoeyi TaxID=1899563 RepID=A0A1H6F8R2_9GAMM|nr:hypothetical protein [Candidatus Venteria ishoeyi]SEH06517.1 Uncharacterised protein [Candidatus Venteria ishoeyi]
MIDFREIRIADLGEFIASDWFNASTDLPITTHRARSQMLNPRAKPDDVCLILALNEEEELLGYIGILPDNFATNEKHVGWLSCWWVHPGKGKKVGLSLFLQALITWDYKFVITDFTPQIKEIIEKTRMFKFTPTKYGVRGFLGFNLSEILPRKRKGLRKIKGILKLADFCMNQINSLRLSILKKKFSSHGLEIDEVQEINDEIAGYIKRHQSTEYYKRAATELNWIIQNPWVLENNEKARSEAEKYYFSSSESIFKYHNLCLRDGGKIVAFVMLRQRNKSFTIPYLYVEFEYQIEVLWSIYDFLLQKKATDFTIFNQEFTDIIKLTHNPFFFFREIPKDFAVSIELGQLLDKNMILQDGDGDYVFT